MMIQNSDFNLTPNQTKISPPENKQELLSRLKPILRSPNPSSSGLTKIIAPAGYGKSTLMYQWFSFFKKQGAICAWLNLDEEDNDLSRLLRYFIAALKNADPDEFKYTISLLNAGTLSELSNFQERLLKDLKRIKCKIYFFIDDLHKLNQKEALDFWQWLLKNRSQKLILIFASRTNIKFLSKFSQTKINYQALSFTQSEVTNYFLKLQKLNLSPQEIRKFSTKTEGWVLALQLCAVILNNEQNKNDFLEKFSGRDQDLFSYLTETVLQCQRSEIRIFLMKTSLMDRFCPNLCDELLDISHSQQLLKEIQKRNLFLISLDSNSNWFRYHHLFQEFLQSTLKKKCFNEMTLVYQKASHWFEKQGLKNEAIHYSLKNKNFDRASLLISHYAVELTSFQGDHSTIFSWIKALPKEYWIQYPVIWVGYITSLVLTSQFSQAREQLDQIKATFKTQNKNVKNKKVTKAQWNYFTCYFEMLEILYATYFGDLEYIKQASPAWLKKYKKPDPFQLIAVQFDHALPFFYENNFEHALVAAKKAYHTIIKSKNYYTLAWMAFWLGIVYLEQGKLQKSYQEIKKHLEKLSEIFPKDSYPIIMLRLHLIEPSYELGNMQECSELIKTGFDQLDFYGGYISFVSVYRQVVRYYLNLGDFKKANEILEHSLRLSQQRGPFYSTLWLVYQKIIFLTNTGKTDRAKKLINEYLNPDRKEIQQQNYLKILSDDLKNLARARIFLKEHHTGQAINILDKMKPQARQLGRNRHLLTILLLKAKARLIEDRYDLAENCLDEALKIGAPQGFVMAFVEELTNHSEFILKIFNRLGFVNNSKPRQIWLRNFIKNAAKD